MNIRPPSLNHWMNTGQVPKQESPLSRAAPADRVRSAHEIATDAQEEVGALHESRNEARGKFLGRTLEKSRGNQRRAIQQIAQLQNLYQLLNSYQPRQQREKLGQIKDKLQKLKPTEQYEPEALLSVSDGDPVLADTLLQLLVSEKSEAGALPDDPLVQRAEMARIALNQTHGEEITAGRNTAEVIAQFSQDPAMKKTMRQLYYGSVINYQSPGHLFDAVMEKFGSSGANKALHTLQRALADDIAALAPSMSPLALRRVMEGLKLLGNINSILRGCRHLMTAISRRQPATALNSDMLARKMVHLAQNGVYANELTQLATQAVGNEPRSQSWFLNALLRLMKDTLPPLLWRDQKTQHDGFNLLCNLTTEFATWEKKQILLQHAR